LDPACGSGNFLTETYISLRRLENDVIRELTRSVTEGQMSFGTIEGGFEPIQVSIKQFYGIEINDFAVTVAKTALWIAESQMMKETEDIVHMNLDFLPLKSYVNIVEGNALRVDWETVANKNTLNYIMGNPPFVGARNMNKAQKEDIAEIFKDGFKNYGNLDYVTAWYKKAADLLSGTAIKAAFVSTNSVSQGEQVSILWKPLMDQYHIHIDFCWRTFKWDSEAKTGKAHVHCVIIGFSQQISRNKKMIYYNESRCAEAANINAYLVDGPNVFIESRNKPLCDVPAIGVGNKPIDGGFYLFEENEMQEFLKKEPDAQKYFHPWYGAREFINRCPRYCLYLAQASPSDLRKLPECRKRIEAVRDYRLNSSSPGTRKLADTPTKFHVTNLPHGSYIVIPQVSSERRRYIPIGYMDDGVLCSDKVRIMPDGSLYHFGILTSNVHMSWMRTICCRLKSDYSYTVNDVYNNFPWPDSSPEQKLRIEATAKAILDARALYPDSSLADLYDELTMPPELRKAHQANDMAVMRAYGFQMEDSISGKKRWLNEAECMAELMKMYQKISCK
jgi:hypothetical protein